MLFCGPLNVDSFDSVPLILLAFYVGFGVISSGDFNYRSYADHYNSVSSIIDPAS